MKPSGIIIVWIALLMAGCGRNHSIEIPELPEGSSYASHLANSIELSMLSRPVESNATSRMFSSSSEPSKVVLAHLAPEIAGDMDHGFFYDVVDSSDGVEATIAEVHGAGEIAWVWSANPSGTISVYIDSKQPVLTMPFKDFLQGKFLPVRQPYASLTSLGYNLHFPILHKKYCKVVISAPSRAALSELFYQIAWQSLPEDGKIASFDPVAIKNGKKYLSSIAARLEAACESMQRPIPSAAHEYLLPPRESQEVFVSNQAAAITSLRVKGESKQALSSAKVLAYWDNDPTPAIDAPLHMLAGVSFAFENTKSLPSTVQGSEVEIRWFMPFSKQGKILLHNNSDKAIKLTTQIVKVEISPADYPLKFHCNYIEHDSLKTDASNILTLADIEGKGRIAGCVLSVDSRSDQWWGEGDHIIWLDDDSVAAWRGTGTEDYFGYAWCSQGIFNEPFRGQTRVAGDKSHRIANAHRYHILDRLPFHRWASFQMEAWGLGEGDMDWATSVMWYQSVPIQGHSLSEDPNNEDDFGNTVADFTLYKLRETEQLSKQLSIAVDPFVSEFFREANTLSWDSFRDRYWCLTEYAGVENPPRPIDSALIVPVKEAIGTRERWEAWNRDSDLMMELCTSILDSMPQDCVFLTGTDEASFSTLAVNAVTKESKVLWLRQNHLGDSRYQEYLRHTYAGKLNIPSKDSIAGIFKHVIHQLQNGSATERKAVSEEGHLANVKGALGVMTVNCAIALKIIELNPNHEFFYEESYVLPQMHPRLEPHGLIMKLHPTEIELTDDIIQRDMEFWRNKVEV